MNRADVLAVLAIVGAWFLAAVTLGAGWALWRGHLKRRTGGWPAPGDGQNPAQGVASPTSGNPVPGQEDWPSRPPPPVRPAPAPGPHDHGGKVKIVELWADGRIRTFDPRTGNVVIRPGFCPACAAGGDWDAALRDLRRGTS